MFFQIIEHQNKAEIDFGAFYTSFFAYSLERLLLTRNASIAADIASLIKKDLTLIRIKLAIL